MLKRWWSGIILAACAAMVCRAAPEQWVEVSSSHFDLYTNGGEKEGRRVLDQLERVRWVFRTEFPTAHSDPPAPIVVMAVKNQRDFQGIEPPTYLSKGTLELGGYFLRAPDTDTIVLRLDAAQEDYPYAGVYHEYTHSQFSREGSLIPLWLNEGLAQFLETIDINGKNVVLGEASKDHVADFERASLMPLEALFRIDENSPDYHREQKASVFYAESWGLTHYLLVNDATHKTNKVGDYIRRVAIAPGPVPPRTRAANTAKYWANYYRKHDESPDALREKITLLNWYKKFADVQAILVAYLTYRPKSALPWMYTALGLAIEENKGKPEETRLMFKYAADAARLSQNPNHLVSVADVLLLRKQYDLVGPLLDQAMEKVPHRAEPMLMSILLAQATKNPKRMADSVEKLLAQGWPGNDEVLRRNARRDVERLARTLREEQRGDEADVMLGRLPDSEARDLFIRLSWTGDADFDMAVAEPLGATATYLTPRTVFGGSIVKNGYGRHPEEVYVSPRGFDGDYAIKIETIYNNPDKPATHGTLEIITHEGTPQESKQTRTISLGGKTPPPIVVTLKGGRRKVVLPLPVPSGDASTAAAAVPAGAAVGKSQTTAARPRP